MTFVPDKDVRFAALGRAVFAATQVAGGVLGAVGSRQSGQAAAMYSGVSTALTLLGYLGGDIVSDHLSQASQQRANREINRLKTSLGPQALANPQARAHLNTVPALVRAKTALKFDLPFSIASAAANAVGAAFRLGKGGATGAVLTGALFGGLISSYLTTPKKNAQQTNLPHLDAEAEDVELESDRAFTNVSANRIVESATAVSCLVGLAVGVGVVSPASDFSSWARSSILPALGNIGALVPPLAAACKQGVSSVFALYRHTQTERAYAASDFQTQFRKSLQRLQPDDHPMNLQEVFEEVAEKYTKGVPPSRHDEQVMIDCLKPYLGHRRLENLKVRNLSAIRSQLDYDQEKRARAVISTAMGVRVHFQRYYSSDSPAFPHC